MSSKKVQKINIRCSFTQKLRHSDKMFFCEAVFESLREELLATLLVATRKLFGKSQWKLFGKSLLAKIFESCIILFCYFWNKNQNKSYELSGANFKSIFFMGFMLLRANIL